MAEVCEETLSAETELDLQSLPGDALEVILSKLDRNQIAALSQLCRSLREASITIFRSSFRRLLDRSARELTVLRNKAVIMREQSLAGHRYSKVALLITTARLVRMELRMLAAATWRHLCAPCGPKLVLPGSLLDQIESVLDSVTHGEMTSTLQPEKTAGLHLCCEKFLDFFCKGPEPLLARTSVEWAPLGSRLADSLSATHTRYIHQEALTRTGQGVRLFATYRLPGLVDAPPTLPRKHQSATDHTAFANAAESILSYLRRSVHMHNLVLVLKDQWAMDDALERRGSKELLSGFIFDHHDQPGECRLARSDTNESCCFSNVNKRTTPAKWDGLLCELQMFAPSTHFLPPHLQHLTDQIWPQSSTDTFKSVSSCPSVKVTAASESPSSSSLVQKRANSRGVTAFGQKRTRHSHSLMTVTGVRNGRSENLQKSLSFDNVDAVKEALQRFSCQNQLIETKTLAADSARPTVKTVDLAIVGNACVCFSFSDLDDSNDVKSKIDISDKLGVSFIEEKGQLAPALQEDRTSIGEAYHFRLHITVRYPETDKTKSGLREATVIVLDSQDGPQAWLVDDVPLT